jgi:multisubunit Na+/H+ antiporter MnhB subunit
MLKKFLKPVKYILIPIGVLVGFVLIWFYLNVNPSESSVFPKCQFHASTGYLCPGCGSQRAAHDFLHFNIIEGFNHNLLVGLLIIALLYLLLVFTYNRLSSKKIPNYLNRPKAAWIVLGVIFVFWVLRNLPFEMFNILRP